MRLAILSDIHGNRTALDAVLADLRQTAPDLIFHGGDLVGSGSSSAEVVDQICDLGWLGVAGNTDEMLATPSAFEDFARELPALTQLWATIREISDFERESLGAKRLAWLGDLPRTHVHGSIALVHASPGSLWKSPGSAAGSEELESVYGSLGQAIAVYGHIHCPFVRNFPGKLVINTGSVSLSYDGDPRASYLLLDGSLPTIRRVEYDVQREIRALHNCGLPHAEWIAKMLESASPQMP